METKDLKLCDVSLMMFSKYRLNSKGVSKQPWRTPTEKRREIITNLQVRKERRKSQDAKAPFEILVG